MEVIMLITAYFIIINLAGFIMMGADKRRAKRRSWRIPEATLFLIAIVGGSIGSIIGMYTFRHKTKHASFVYGMPAILVIQIIIILALLNSSLHFIIL